MSILIDADDIIHSERVKMYGPASVTFEEVAKAFVCITGIQVTGADVALLQVLFKLKRNRFSPDNTDHCTDACGYIGIMSDIQEETKCKK